MQLFSGFFQSVINKYYKLKTKNYLDNTVWNIFTHTTEQERFLLFKLASSLAENSTIVEIGSYLGASTCFLAAGCLKNNGHVYAIDTWQNDAMSEGKRDTFEEFKRNTKRYEKLISPIRSNSREAGEKFLKTVDLLFVDGDHSYEGVVADLKTWLPKMRNNSWLLLHDWGWAQGVKQAIEEIVKPIENGRPITLPNLYAVKVMPAKNDAKV